MNFAMTGVAGYIAPRHLKAIRDTGNILLAATDPHDSVGILDSFFPDAAYFRETERFDRHLERLRRGAEGQHIHFLSVCSPNYLHDAHIRIALRVGANAICEKPLVVNPWNLDALQILEEESERRIYTVLQLRLLPSLCALRERLLADGPTIRKRVELTYITSRGTWYAYSWKGDEARSGGIAVNIGIHFFDLLIWLFGPVRSAKLHLSEAGRMAGALELANADVTWFLSIKAEDLPAESRQEGRPTLRSLVVDGSEVEFSEGFRDLHTRVYEEILAGNGLGIEDSRPSIELVHAIRTSKIETARPNWLHPFAQKHLGQK